jgi:hypothetical protein
MTLNLVASLMAEWLFRPEYEDFIINLIENRMDDGSVAAWKAQQGPTEF